MWKNTTGPPGSTPPVPCSLIESPPCRTDDPRSSATADCPDRPRPHPTGAASEQGGTLLARGCDRGRKRPADSGARVVVERSRTRCAASAAASPCHGTANAPRTAVWPAAVRPRRGSAARARRSSQPSRPAPRQRRARTGAVTVAASRSTTSPRSAIAGAGKGGEEPAGEPGLVAATPFRSARSRARPPRRGAPATSGRGRPRSTAGAAAEHHGLGRQVWAARASGAGRSPSTGPAVAPARPVGRASTGSPTVSTTTSASIVEPSFVRTRR